MPVGVRDLERELNYAAIVVRLDNPRLTSVIAEFTETVQLLSRQNSGKHSNWGLNIKAIHSQLNI